MEPESNALVIGPHIVIASQILLVGHTSGWTVMGNRVDQCYQ